MRWKDIIYLIPVTEGENDIGDPLEIDGEPIEVFANQKSIRQSEFYQAAATPLRPEIMFEIRSEEYNDESKLTYEGKTYDIIRTYSKNGEILELICTGQAGE